MNHKVREIHLQNPIFNLKSHSLSSEILKEILYTFADSNNEMIRNPNKYSGYFKQDEIASFMINVCNRFNLNMEGKILALELFDRFMWVHLEEIEDAVKKTPDRQWRPVLEKIQNQLILRALSCIQIANKLTSSYMEIKCSQIKQILAELKYNYSLDSILSSELRVLKYVNYKTNIKTPLQYIELLLEILGKNNQDIQPKLYYLIAVNILECVYLKREAIYDRLYESITGRIRDHIHDRDQFLPMENNYLYLSSAIIVASVHVYSQTDKETYEKILRSISEITNLDKDDINEFAVAICYITLLEDEILQ